MDFELGRDCFFGLESLQVLARQHCFAVGKDTFAFYLFFFPVLGVSFLFGLVTSAQKVGDSSLCSYCLLLKEM